jgi:polar amino acid transport system substrate-binding protein
MGISEHWQSRLSTPLSPQFQEPLSKFWQALGCRNNACPEASMNSVQFFGVVGVLATLLHSPANALDSLKAVAANLQPYLIENSPQEPGFGYEVATEMARRAGYKLEIEFMPWARAQAVAKETPGTLVVGMARSPERAPNYSWLVLLYAPKVVFVTTKRPIDSIEQARTVSSITVVPVSPQEKDLRDAGINSLELIENPQTSAKMLESGRVDAWLTHDLRAAYIWKKLGFAPDQLVMGKPMRNEQIFLAGHKDIQPGLAVKLQAAMDSMVKDGTYDGLYRKYFGQPSSAK